MFPIATEVARELVRLVTAYFARRKNLRLACAIVVLLGAARLGTGLLSQVTNGPHHNFTYPQLSGTCLYADGKRIPVRGLTLHFLSAGEDHGDAGNDHLGVALVDDTTGAFHCILRVLPDQMSRGLRVAVVAHSGIPVPGDLVPLQYSDPNATPLHALPRAGRLDLRIEKPPS